MASEHCKCPNCDGVLEYRADHRKFGCESCLSFFSDEQVKTMFRGKSRSDSKEQKSSDGRAEEFCRGSLFRCSECGAEMITAYGKKLENCAFCGGTPDREESLPEEYLPECIIPFEITRDRAAEIFRESISPKKFAVSGLCSDDSLGRIRGIYVPVWMADCSVSINMNGTGKVVKSWVHDVHRYTETKEFAAERKADAEYTSVPSDFTGILGSDCSEFLQNYDFGKLKRIEPSDLLTHPAEYCTVNKGEAFRCVREKVTVDVRNVLKNSVSDYAEFDVKNEEIDILGTKWCLGLLPVWLLTFRSGGKTYRFTVNGQNGEFTGAPPVSVKKLALFGAAAVLGVTLLYRLADTLAGFSGSPESSGYAFRGYGIGAIAGTAAAITAIALLLKRYRPVHREISEVCNGEGETFFTAKYDRYVRQYTTKIKTEEA